MKSGGKPSEGLATGRRGAALQLQAHDNAWKPDMKVQIQSHDAEKKKHDRDAELFQHRLKCPVMKKAARSGGLEALAAVSASDSLTLFVPRGKTLRA